MRTAKLGKAKKTATSLYVKLIVVGEFEADSREVAIIRAKLHDETGGGRFTVNVYLPERTTIELATPKVAGNNLDDIKRKLKVIVKVILKETGKEIKLYVETFSPREAIYRDV